MELNNADRALHSLFHARIVLHKPMLARYCSSGQLPGHSLKTKIFRDCAIVCVENAQKMAELVDREHNPGSEHSSMTWWHRVFYLHVAGSVLLASMLQPEDLFTQSVSQSWQTTMLRLRAHAHLGAPVQQCIATFEKLSARITESQQTGSGADKAGVDPPPSDRHFSNEHFEDVLHDLGIDLDGSVFGLEDMGWPGSSF